MNFVPDKNEFSVKKLLISPRQKSFCPRQFLFAQDKTDSVQEKTCYVQAESTGITNSFFGNWFSIFLPFSLSVVDFNYWAIAQSRVILEVDMIQLGKWITYIPWLKLFITRKQMFSCHLSSKMSLNLQVSCSTNIHRSSWYHYLFINNGLGVKKQSSNGN